MGMYGDKDIVVHPEQWKLLSKGIPDATIQRFPTAGHFIMLDEPSKFNRLAADFLSLAPGQSPRQLQIREEWKRRVR